MVEVIGEGDSHLIPSVFTNSITEDQFQELKQQFPWQTMHHAGGAVPRLVCCQASIAADGSKPIYRHPSDEILPTAAFTHAIDEIRQKVEDIVGHELNHALIQLYRSGEDFISEHSDKTLDIMHGSTIVNVSLGAQRTMRLRMKKSAISTAEGGGRRTQLVPLPHGSVFLLGQQTNIRWLHSIKADKRPLSQRSEEEKAFGGERISITFRWIGTFLDREEDFIWGLGAMGKRFEDRQAVVDGDARKAQEMINAFGFENQRSEFDWEEVYGKGFDELHSTRFAEPTDTTHE